MQSQCCLFWGPTKHIKPKWIPNFLLGNCSWSKMKVFANFQKIHLLLSSLRFFEKEKSRRFSGIGLIKIYLIGSIVPIFKNHQKVLNHSTLLYREEWRSLESTYLPNCFHSNNRSKDGEILLLVRLAFIYEINYIQFN